MGSEARCHDVDHKLDILCYCCSEIKHEIGLNNCCIASPSKLYPFVCKHSKPGKLDNAVRCALLHSDSIDSSSASVDHEPYVLEHAWSNLVSLGAERQVTVLYRIHYDQTIV